MLNNSTKLLYKNYEKYCNVHIYTNLPAHQFRVKSFSGGPNHIVNAIVSDRYQLPDSLSGIVISSKNERDWLKRCHE